MQINQRIMTNHRGMLITRTRYHLYVQALFARQLFFYPCLCTYVPSHTKRTPWIDALLSFMRRPTLASLARGKSQTYQVCSLAYLPEKSLHTLGRVSTIPHIDALQTGGTPLDKTVMRGKHVYIRSLGKKIIITRPARYFPLAGSRQWITDSGANNAWTYSCNSRRDVIPAKAGIHGFLLSQE